MCGIVAIYDKTGFDNSSDCERGLHTLAHRGPDAHRRWRSPCGMICLGHARLSIIDLTTGDQPLTNEDGSIHCIVNGEFYDFERIRSELETRGHQFRTNSDSEILIHLYEDLGTACLQHLRGEFSFILWDANRRLLMAARDRFGIKPLYYATAASRLLLASEVKALHAAGLPAEWDEQGFLESFASIFSPSPTLFRGVAAIPAGHYLLARGTSFSLHKYWDFDFPLEENLPARPDEEYAEELHSILDEAVRLRLRADVPVGCYLSGGIDSSSVLALMTRHTTQPVRAFSLSFDHPLYDEEAIARETAQAMGSHLTVIPADHSTIAADMSDALWHNENLFRNAGCAALFGLSRAVRNAGYRVVLTGEGSDEIFAGYAGVRQDAMRHGGGNYSRAAIEKLRASSVTSGGIMFTGEAVTPVADYIERIGYFPSFLEAHKVRLDRFRPIITIPYETDELLTRILNRLDVGGQLNGRHVLNKSLYLGAYTTLQGYTLSALGDRVQMAHSVEARLPFLDHHLVEFTRKLPVTMKLRGITEKFVLREAMKPVLPAAIYRRPKHPFFAPPGLLNPGEPLYVLLQDTLRGRALQRVPYFDREEVIRFLDRTSDLDVGGKIAAEFPLMMILSACLIAERFRL